MEFSKEFYAEEFITALNDYSNFYNDFIKTFDLSNSQCIALCYLCDLAKTYGKMSATLIAIDMTSDEAFEIVNSYA